MDKKKILIGVAVGAAVGTALGALIAPAKGSATRKNISRKSLEISNDAKKKIKEYSDVATKEYNALKKSAEKIVKTGKKKAATFMNTKK